VCYRTQVCNNRTQVCVNRTQARVNRTQVCVNRTQERDLARDPARVLSVPACWGLEGDAAAMLNLPTVQVRRLLENRYQNDWYQIW
jgi:hypothetical protein